jgi:hypothetical protein
MIGEVSTTEMQDLRQHLSECAECREQYREFTQFLLPQLSMFSDNAESFETGYSAADKKRLRKEFLARAQRSGFSFSKEALSGPSTTAVPTMSSFFPVHAERTLYRWALAASIATLLFVGGYATHLALVQREMASARGAVGTTAASRPGQAGHDSNSADDAVAQRQAKDEADTKAIEALQEKLSGTTAELQKTQYSLKVYEAGQSALLEKVSEKNGQIATLQSQAQGNEQSANRLRTQVAQLQERVADGQAALAVNQLRIRDLNDQLAAQTASLDRERQMLAIGRDVRDLMGARNLHIIDVHDANGSGKDRKSFGRAFYTEGKSLIFYAFDLDDKKTMNANYTYKAWGERLGQPASVKSLGVLYVDDKAQRRWLLKVDNPQQLAEINSVFVTLEPRNGDGDKPQGKRILYAFLGGEANHP